MAVNLTQTRHSIGRLSEDHFKDLDNIGQVRSGSPHRHGLYLSRSPRVSPRKPKRQSIGPADHTPQGGSMIPSAQSPAASPKRESINPNADGGEGVYNLDQQNEQRQQQHGQSQCQGDLDHGSSEDEEPPPPPPKDTPLPPNEDCIDTESCFNSRSLSPTNSMYTISRASFTRKLSQLTILELPEASSLGSDISAIPTVPAAATALSGAAGKLQSWIQKASEVLGGLDAEDDVEWAAAGGREGLEEVESAAASFEELVGVYVAAIEELQLREDISEVPREELETVVEQMERTMTDWKAVSTLVKGVKEQVELAMEWEELWGVVLGDIGLEMEALGRLVFEMEEKRHKSLTTDTGEHGNGFDIAELETIVEETPIGGVDTANHRFSLPPAFPTSSPIHASSNASAQDDSSLMALFARMQPLRASLDFLPMRLSTFLARAESVLPTACQELEARRVGLEKKWVTLERDAESLRCELGEDRWVLVFRNAGRQAQKMCESVERSVDKLQEAIDTGAQHSNPPALAKKVDNYEAKKIHYGPAIQRVLAIIEKGLNDRLTVNGEILRLHSEMQSRWSALEASMRDMDVALDDLNLKKSQQLRDSLSSIISMDRSAAGSAFDTPRSSPASSVVMGPTSGNKADPLTPGAKASSRRGSFMSSTASRPGTAKRYFSMPPGSAGSSNIPRKAPTPRSSVSSSYTNSALSSPTGLKNGSSTPTPYTRNQRPSVTTIDGRPRWTSSGNMNGTVVGHNFKPLSMTTPSPQRRTSTPMPRPLSRSSRSSIPLPSPLSRENTASPATTTPHSPTLPRTKRLSGLQSSLPFRDANGKPSPSPAPIPAPTSRTSLDLNNRPKLNNTKSSTSYFSPSPNVRRQSATVEPADMMLKHQQTEPVLPQPEGKPVRPSTAMAAGRRSSMLPQPRARVASGRESATGTSIAGPNLNGEERRWR